MLRYLVILLFLPLSTLLAQTYEPNWPSLNSRPVPEWWKEGKFGIFIHWGVYSVPAYTKVGQYAEWYWNQLISGDTAVTAFHNRAYGKNFSYRQFAPMFKAELFDPKQWADFFSKSGAKYIVLTSKHHDGFCLWKSEEANRDWGGAWNSVDIGPNRDLLGDLSDAVKAAGLKMGIYYSLYEWYNPLYLANKDVYIEKHMMPQFKDVVSRYKPSVIFSDGEWDLPSQQWHSPELLSWLFNESPVKDEVVINDRWGKDERHLNGGYFTTEYGSGMPDATHAWEENRGMGFSYGYNRAETVNDYRTPQELILMLIDIVSRGGNFLLDIGPTADGRIPVVMQERLLQMGKWLEKNGEAIYGTSTWKQVSQWSEGKRMEIVRKEFRSEFDILKLTIAPDEGQAHIEMFFTKKGNNLYAIAPQLPENHTLTIQGVKPSASTKIYLLGQSEPLEWQEKSGKIVIQVPEQVEQQYAYSFKITAVGQ